MKCMLSCSLKNKWKHVHYMVTSIGPACNEHILHCDQSLPSTLTDRQYVPLTSHWAMVHMAVQWKYFKQTAGAILNAS